MHSERIAYIEKLNNEQELSCEDVAALVAEVRQLEDAKSEVYLQAESPLLWGQAATMQSVHLQTALRRLHEIIEGKTSEQCARAVLD